MFATSIKNTPVYNTCEIDKIFQKPYPFDKSYLLRQLELVAYPGTVFKVVKENEKVLEVKLDTYPIFPLFIDKRFVLLAQQEGKPRAITLPSKEELLFKFETFPRCTYIWGGNIPEGIPEHLDYYKVAEPLTPFEYGYHILKGVDCSGLIYHVTNGFTPRNTSELYSFGYEVHSLKPLDLILRKGHVLVVLPQDRVIESREKNGVIVSPLNDRLKELESEAELTFIRWV